MSNRVTKWEGKFKPVGPLVSDDPPLLDHGAVQKIMAQVYRQGGDELLNNLCKTRRDFSAVCKNHLWYMEVFYMLMKEDFPQEFVELLPRYFDRLDETSETGKLKLNNWKGFYKAAIKAQKALKEDIELSSKVRDGQIVEAMQRAVARRFEEPEIAPIYAKLLYTSKFRIGGSAISFGNEKSGKSGEDVALDVLGHMFEKNKDFTLLVDKQGLLFDDREIYSVLVLRPVNNTDSIFKTILLSKYANKDAIYSSIDQANPEFEGWLDAFKSLHPRDSSINNETLVYLAYKLDKKHHEVVFEKAGEKLVSIYYKSEYDEMFQKWLETIFVELLSMKDNIFNPFDEKNLTSEKLKHLFSISSTTIRQLRQWAFWLSSKGNSFLNERGVDWIKEKLMEKLPQLQEEEQIKRLELREYANAIYWIENIK